MVDREGGREGGRERRRERRREGEKERREKEGVHVYLSLTKTRDSSKTLSKLLYSSYVFSCRA